MMTDPKEFQKHTIEAAFQALSDKSGSRRYLVADEVGLGKTIVAQHVVDRMMKKTKGRPLVVFYVCSSLSIAHQNKGRLLEVLPLPKPDSKKPTPEDASCSVDRLTLLPAYGRPKHPRLNLFTLTPDTSIPERGNRRRDGRVDERALVCLLLQEVCKSFFEKFLPDDDAIDGFFQCNAKSSWGNTLELQEQKLKEIREKSERKYRQLCKSFERTLRSLLKDAKGHTLPAKLHKLESNLAVIAKLRTALASVAIQDISPDLVIMDEFQRFDDLVDPEVDVSNEGCVIEALRGDASPSAPSLLMLSATPYRLYSSRWEDDHNNSTHYKEFFKLINFLYGSGETGATKEQECQVEFSRLERELRNGRIASAESREIRRKIRTLLTPIMTRTERASHFDGWNDSDTNRRVTSLEREDLKVFRHLVESFEDKHKSWAVPYWMSIPMPMQTMGSHYVARKSAKPKRAPNSLELRKVQRDKFAKPSSWPHPRFRELINLFPVEQLALPWQPPSLPWWDLSGHWANTQRETSGKLLIFSRFRAVPQTIASLLSYELECALLEDADLTYDVAPARRGLVPSNVILALFHPSSFLCRAVEPLAASGRPIQHVREVAREQLKAALERIGVTVKGQDRGMKLWEAIARIEKCAQDRETNCWETSFQAWQEMDTHVSDDSDAESTRALSQLVKTWNEAANAPPLTTLPENIFADLVEHALFAPGCVLGRAILRHWSEAMDPENFHVVLGAAWKGLRNYLAQRWFVALLTKSGSGTRREYPKAVQQAVEQGNLEGVLDEHLWIIQQLYNQQGDDLVRELQQALKLRASTFKLHSPNKIWRSDDKERGGFTLRSHVGMPFTDVKQVSYREGRVVETGNLHTNELRKAFNTPFWPHVLATTSVGQEGLDFHAWCSRLVHWDLCSNPMDLEQREGRIQRYGGLSIRRAVAAELGDHAFREVINGDNRLPPKTHDSPWRTLKMIADLRLEGDGPGLSPWWVHPNAKIDRYLLEVPNSEQSHRFRWMMLQRMLYRLALGQPNQEDLIEVMAERFGKDPKALDSDTLRQASIGISAYFDSDE